MKNEIISKEDYKRLHKKKNKFGAKPIILDDIKFDSKLERDYYSYLKLKIRAGEIKSFELHKRIDLVVNGELICFMKPDFVITNKDGSISYHDTKGMVTPLFKLKAKLFKALKDREIKIISRDTLF